MCAACVRVAVCVRVRALFVVLCVCACSEGYIVQLRRTVKDLSKTREVVSDGSGSHSLVLHALEGMVEAYLGLNESVREMIKYQQVELRQQEKDDQAEENRLQRLLQQHRTLHPDQFTSPPPPAAATAAAAAVSPASGAAASPSSDAASPAPALALPATDAMSPPSRTEPFTPRVYEGSPSPPAVAADSTAATAPNSSSSSTASTNNSSSSSSSTSGALVPPSPLRDASPELIAAVDKRGNRERRWADLLSDHAALNAVKKHCVKMLRALRNLHMLVTGVDTLKDILADKEFQAARLAFQACTDIFSTLTLYSRLNILTSLNEHVEIYKAHLRKEIFNSFREHVGNSLHGVAPLSPVRAARPAAAHSSKLASLARLHHCCRLIDLQYSTLERKELVKWFVAVQLHSYQQKVSRREFGDVTGSSGPSVYGPSGVLVAFEQQERQFAYIWTELRDMYDAEYAQVFPPGWHVDAVFTRRFFELLRGQFAAALEVAQRRVKEENEARRALIEAQKAQALMKDIDRYRMAGASSNAAALRKRASGAGHVAQTSSSDLAYAHSPDPEPTNGTGGATGGGTGGGAGAGDDADGGDTGATSPGVNGSGGVVGGGSGSSSETAPLVFDFYGPLLRTIEFENQIRARWLNAHTEATLSEEDLFAVLGTVAAPAPNPDLNKSSGGGGALSNPPPFPFQFAGYISSAFHPYLTHMLLSERTRFYNFLESLDAKESWEVESADVSSCHFSAATKLFVMIQKSVERYSKVMPGDYFLDLFKEHRTSISNYLELLSKHLPTGRALEEEESQSICVTINTNDYVLDRCSLLANTVVQMLSGHTAEQLEGAEGELSPEAASFIGVLREQVDLSGVEEQVSHLNHRATHVLAGHIVRRLEPLLAHMKGAAGGIGGSGGGGGGSNGSIGMAAVTDENKYVREIIQSLRMQLADKAAMSSFAYLAQVVAHDFLALYYATLRAAPFKITEGVAQQMLLDLQALKNFLIQGIQEIKVRADKIATKGRVALEKDERMAGGVGGAGSMLSPLSSAAASLAAAPGPSVAPAFKAYVKMINAQIAPSENLLKALTSPAARLIQTYKIIFPRSDAKAVLELLHLRGLSSGEQEKLIRAYNATQPNPAAHIPIVKQDFFGSMKQMVRDVKHSIQ